MYACGEISIYLPDDSLVSYFMNKSGLSNLLGCLIQIAIIVVVIYLLMPNGKSGNPYLVKETGYFHSAKNKDTCRFYIQAKESGYTIKRVDTIFAVMKGYRICKFCYSKEEQDSYNEKLNKKIVEDAERNEYLKWENLNIDKQADYNDLFVYIDGKDVLHISYFCASDLGRNRNFVKIPFSQIETISSTCEECVGAEFCDFIYKAVYEGVYDTDLIKEVDDYDTD